jgi:primosomal protein N' (replication factor Y)
MHQIAGRAGREIEKSKILIQTFNPGTSFLKSLTTGNIKEFYDFEIANRKKYNLPPFSKFIAIIVSSNFENKSLNCANEVVGRLKQYKNIQTLGPAKAPIFFLRNKYRYRILLKVKKQQDLTKLLSGIGLEFERKDKVKVKIDVDPISFM